MHILIFKSITGDVVKDEKMSLALLCHTLPRKGNGDILLLIYEEFKVINKF